MGLLSSVFTTLFVKPQRLPMFLVTLDALGTLYTFRQPVAVQYLQVARQCGLDAKIDPKELDQAFRKSYKHHNSTYPNYGKNKLESPEIWWHLLVNQAFSQLVEGGESALPSNLGSALYKHFSSGAAYEPFPDVKPFLQSMAALKRRFTHPDGPIVLTGVVTNSDPRVAVVLRDLGFRVGPSSLPNFQDVTRMAREAAGDTSATALESVFRGYYNVNNDFDVLSTSYEADAEKPSGEIWDRAELLAHPTGLSRGEQSIEIQPTESLRSQFWKTASAVKYRIDNAKKMRIHVGDEYSKDYLGAANAGWEALHLAREEDQLKGIPDGAKVVRSLDEVAMIVNVMANEFFEQAKA
jgi:putative hydrolase of the HAD superfamily